MEIRIKIFEDEKDYDKILGLVKALRYPNNQKTFSEFLEVIKDVEFLASFDDLKEFLKERI